MNPAVYVLTFLSPAFYLWRYIKPIGGSSLFIGNDFANYSFPYTAYFADAVVNGGFPLWSPSESAGFPFLSSPLTMAFYPLNLIPVLVRWISGGYTYADHQRYTVLALCIFAAGLLAWLQRLRAPLIPAAAASIVIGISFFPTSFIRFTIVSHAMAWLPWILFGITLAAERGRTAAGGLIAGAAVLMLLTTAFPQYYLAGFAVLALGALAFSLRHFRDGMFFTPLPAYAAPGRIIAAAVAAAVVPLVLVSPYLALVSRTTALVAGREFSLQHASQFAFTPVAALAGLLYPPLSAAHGWVFFGSAGTILVLAAWLNAATSRNGGRGLAGLAMLWAGATVVISFGPTAATAWLWELVPQLQGMRVWPRLNVLLLPLLALLLCRGLLWLAGPHSVRRRLATVIAVTAVVLAGQAWLQFGGLGNSPDGAWADGWRRYIDTQPTRRFLLMAAISGAALAGMTLLPRRWALAPIAAGVLVLCANDVGRTGRYQFVLNRLLMAGELARAPVDVPDRIAAGLEQPRLNVSDTVLSLRRPNFTVRPSAADWYFDYYQTFYQRFYSGGYRSAEPVAAEAELKAFNRLMHVDGGSSLYVTTRFDHDDPQRFLADADSRTADIRPVRYDGDRLEVTVRTAAPGWLTFIDNWDPAWIARVNGRPVAIERSFGTFKSVPVEAGENTVIFDYRPFASLGLLGWLAAGRQDD